MLTWLIPVARTACECRGLTSIGQVRLIALGAIVSAYELPAARVLRGGGRRGLVHARSAAYRDHPALPVAAHQGARDRGRRSTARPAAARRLADPGRQEPAAGGAHGRARTRAWPPGRAGRARPRVGGARDRDRPLDGGRLLA